MLFCGSELERVADVRASDLKYNTDCHCHISNIIIEYKEAPL